jgi:hypothetical protein
MRAAKDLLVSLAFCALEYKHSALTLKMVTGEKNDNRKNLEKLSSSKCRERNY